MGAEIKVRLVTVTSLLTTHLNKAVPLPLPAITGTMIHPMAMKMALWKLGSRFACRFDYEVILQLLVLMRL